MTFEEYLTKRRVTVAAFAAAEPQRFAEWQNWFGQMHPESFYIMVKMVLNDVRRNYWLAEVPKPVAAVVSETAATNAPARPAGRRAAIARPATVTSETAKPEIPTAESAKPTPEIPESKATETASSATGTPAETPAAKPGRPVFKPRAVIKKPAASSEETSAEVPETGKAPAESPAATAPAGEIKPEAEKPTTENPEPAAPKPARPRAVIKRPAALTKPAETEEKTAGNSAEKPPLNNPETAGENAEKSTAGNTEAPKLPRPRPVFKRPAAAAANSETAPAESEKTVGETPQKPEAALPPEVSIDSPVAKPGQEGASETKALAEEIHNNPKAAEAAEEVSAAVGHVPLTPRPRPVFKRPAPKPPENKDDAAGKTVGETAPKPEAASTGETIAEESEPKTEENAPAEPEVKQEETNPKPPRPRPVFKRPPKPENDNP